MSTATSGRAREHKVRDAMTEHGWSPIMRAAASKGPADLLLGHEEHGGALVQVGTANKQLGPADRDRFVTAADLIGALPHPRQRHPRRHPLLAREQGCAIDLDGVAAMTPDDPRHGTYAGAVAHWMSGQRPCEDCAVAEMRYRKLRKMRHLRGDAPMVPSVGALRRVQALLALGHTGPQVAAAAGISVHAMRSIGYHQSVTIRRATAEAIENAYEQLCMTRPEGKYADRGRSIARRRGWIPPLAWLDIDDPDERPVNWQYKAQDRAELLADLDHRGENLTTAATVLGISADGVERWCQRHGHNDLYRRLVERERPHRWANQYGEGGAA